MSKLEAENILAAGLYIVSTPIGNLGDLSDRAKTILAGVDLVLCEDSRVSGKLLNFFTISNRLSPYHEHNAVQVRDGILEKLADGQRIALISDAGTPAIADPGFKLVRAARQAGICVFSVPGPSALIAALSISGLPTDRFFFQGFLPSRQPARRQLLQTLKEMPGTLVCYESPKRLVDTLEDAAEIIGDRAVAVARELTKIHEEIVFGNLSEIHHQLSVRPTLRGEIVLMIAPPGDDRQIEQNDIDEALLAAMVTLSPSKAAAKVAKETGLPRQQLYQQALRLKST